MNRNKLYSALLLLWVVLAVVICVFRIYTLGDLINNSGPQALTADGQGGFYLATNTELLHFGPNEKLLERTGIRKLGLQNIKALTQGEGTTLWVYDAGPHRVFRCDEGSLSCSPFGPEKLGLDFNVSLVTSPPPDSHLIISDDTNQRLVVLGSSGQLIDDGHGKTWHFPNQISRSDDGLLLADANRFAITRLDASQPNGSDTPLLHTLSRPYRFVRRGEDWWVVEAGISLTRGWVMHYRGSSSPDDSTSHIAMQSIRTGGAVSSAKAQANTAAMTPTRPPQRLTLKFWDIVAIADTGSQIIIASKSDWGLLVLDPASDASHDLGDAQVQADFRQQAQALAAAETERGHMPLIMVLAILPALILAGLLQRRMDAGGGASGLVRTDPVAGITDGAINISAHVLMQPDAAELEKLRVLQKKTVKYLGIAYAILAALLVTIAVSFPHGHGYKAIAAMAPLIAMLLVVPVIIYAQRQRVETQFSQSLECGIHTLTLYRQGKPVSSVEYGKVWLCDAVLVLDKLIVSRALSLKDMKSGKMVSFPIWSPALVDKILRPRLPPEQVFGSRFELARACFRAAPAQALRLMGREIGLTLLCMLLIVQMLFRFHLLHF
jgi:hypothetical protein